MSYNPKQIEIARRNVFGLAGPDIDLTAAEAERRTAARSTLLDFTRYTKPNYETNWHHEVICKYLDMFISGQIPRLMLFMPPRHGKTELASRRLPAYLFGKNPKAQIIATSYGADLAQRINRDVQRIIDNPLYAELFPDTYLSGTSIKFSSKGSWLRTSDIFEIVGHGGTYRSAGVGGGITGMGADFAIIDDPVKSREDANSQRFRDKTWEWYTSTLLTRLEKAGKVLMILTRWHEDDLAGRALKLAASDPKSDQWTVVEFPAILDTGPGPDDPRVFGDPLWPGKYDAAALDERQRSIGIYDWNALYQQRPLPLGGGLLKVAWFGRCPVQKEYIRIIQSWDTAQKAKDSNDYSVCTTWGDRGDGHYILLDVLRRRLEYPELERMVVIKANEWEPSAVLIEDKSSGVSLIQSIRKNTNISVIPIIPEADKATRAMVESPKMESGRVWVPEEHRVWIGPFLDEVAKFPQGEFDDQVDSMTQFLGWIGNSVTAAWVSDDPSPPERGQIRGR